MKHTVYVYVFDTMADYEIGYATVEMNTGRYYKKGLAPSKIVTVGRDMSPVTTLGGLKLYPDIPLEACSMDRSDLLILPGGNTWTEAIHHPVLKLAEKCLTDGMRVAAICGATMGLAQAGLLDSRAHTSNDLAYLKAICPTYTGEKHFKMASAVTDGNLITASGIAPLEFTFHILKALEVFSPAALTAWYNLYKTGDAPYYYELMNATQ